MSGTLKTRAELFEDFDAPFATGNEPGNADFQDFGASYHHLSDPLLLPVSVAAMVADETFTDAAGISVYERDTNGAARTLNPSGTFRSGRLVYVINTGAQTLTFDSGGLAAAIATGQRGQFIYTGASWRRLFVG